MAYQRIAHIALAACTTSVITLVSGQSTVILGPTGACQVLPEATVEAQPVVYSQYIDHDTAIAPFSNGFIYIISNAPTTFVVSTTVYITNYAGTTGVPTAQFSIPVSTTTGSPSTTTELRLGEGLPSGTVTNLPTDTSFVLGWVGLNLPTKRDLEDNREVRSTPDQDDLRPRAPVQAVSNILNAAAAAQTGGASNWISGNNAGPVSCNLATAYSLVNGQLLQGSNPIGKYQGDTVVAFGAALNGNANPIINVGFSMINGLLAWQPPDVGLAVFYSCGGVVYAAFDPTDSGLAVAPYGNCSLVAIGGLSSTTCSASLDILPISSVSVQSIRVPSLSSINPTGFLSVQTPRISSIALSEILAGLSSLSIPTQLPSLLTGSLSINTARPSLSSINLALTSITIPSTINLSPSALSSINLALPSLSSLVIPSQLPSLGSLNLGLPSITIPSTINLAPPSISSINIALPSITIPSISIGSLTLQTPVLSTLSIVVPSISIGSLSLSTRAPPDFTTPTALPSVSIASLGSFTLPSVSFPSLGSLSLASFSIPTPQIDLTSFSTTFPFNLPSSSIVLNLSPPSNSPVSLAPPSVPVVTIPTSLTISTPQITLPSAPSSSISLPSPGSLSLLSFSLPSLGSISLPSISLPSSGSISLPSGSLASITLPSFTLPSVSVPVPFAATSAAGLNLPLSLF